MIRVRMRLEDPWDRIAGLFRRSEEPVGSPMIDPPADRIEAEHRIDDSGSARRRIRDQIGDAVGGIVEKRADFGRACVAQFLGDLLSRLHGRLVYGGF
jgi:hypothetical protein